MYDRNQSVALKTIFCKTKWSSKQSLMISENSMLQSQFYAEKIIEIWTYVGLKFVCNE